MLGSVLAAMRTASGMFVKCGDEEAMAARGGVGEMRSLALD